MSRRKRITLALVLFAALLVATLVRRGFSGAQEKPAGPTLSVAAPKRELFGVTSCSASVCHGGGDLGRPLSEATTWRALDPHARAYDTLLSRESAAIATHLWGDKKQAHEAPLCLKCHVHPEYDHARPNFRKQDGVGCESCHGAAQDWLKPHYRESWQQADKQAYGMADTQSLPGRANVCVKCHVGTAEANVDHDLIAAGHPALRFEFATYLANLPPHWDAAKDKKERSTDARKVIDFEARAWAIGQLVTTQSALELLAHRADPETAKPWPEFAEMDCFSCHHDLQVASWRQSEKRLQGRRPGALAWADWYYAELPDLFATSNRSDIAMRAAGHAKKLRDTPAAPVGVALTLDRLRNAKDHSWDQATQRYLALLALQAMRKDNKQPGEPELERLITKSREEITFPNGLNSPRRFVPASRAP